MSRRQATWPAACSSPALSSFDTSTRSYSSTAVVALGVTALASIAPLGDLLLDSSLPPKRQARVSVDRQQWFPLRRQWSRGSRRLRCRPPAAAVVVTAAAARSFAVAAAITADSIKAFDAAEGASSYWRGKRVQAFEEPDRPAPVIDRRTGEIEYNGEPEVQECLEYYIDKHFEQELHKKMSARELEVAADFSREEELHGRRNMGVAGGGEPRGLIAYLLMENAGRTVFRDLLLSLHSLGRFFGHYPVAVFHTNASTRDELRALSTRAPGGLRLFFEEVSMGFPPELSNAPGGPDGFLAPPRCMMDGRHWWISNRSCGCRCPAWRPQCWPLNWMHATRFFTAGMFRTRTFQSGAYDYFMRLDTDLFFVREPVVDPFRLMQTRGCSMMYDRLSRETPGCADGFDLRTLEFLRQYLYIGLLDEDILNVGRGPAAAGGQWSVGDARLFTSKPYLEWADFAASGIYTDRWADQLFLVRGLAMFGPRSSMPTVRFSDAQGERVIPEVSICVRPIFSDTIGDETTAVADQEDGVNVEANGFVHQKGGYLDPALLRRCEVDPSIFTTLPQAP
eukprot:TRINITY_DN63030_c0_g1_i1.p1 TRINITY_DN63030_c0_g1~~TRINITY_DN63030_c0_g1_i1.p1  ORF type:complete len:565 (+),score=77.48 TRINITY_DN63030_c0_g1_i1:180-1874(+)